MQHSSDWELAEEFALDHMRHLGFKDARMNSGGADGGIDLESAAAAGQVKHLRSKVSRPDVQRFHGAAPANKLRLFYSLAGYSREAKLWAEENNIALFVFDLSDYVAEPVTSVAIQLDKGLSDPEPPQTVPHVYRPPVQTTPSPYEAGSSSSVHHSQIPPPVPPSPPLNPAPIPPIPSPSSYFDPPSSPPVAASASPVDAVRSVGTPDATQAATPGVFAPPPARPAIPRWYKPRPGRVIGSIAWSLSPLVTLGFGTPITFGIAAVRRRSLEMVAYAAVYLGLSVWMYADGGPGAVDGLAFELWLVFSWILANVHTFVIRRRVWYLPYDPSGDEGALHRPEQPGASVPG
ncbi:restriction endonuclease [Glycomyces tarimensis]